MDTIRSRTIKAAAAYYCLSFGAGFVLGAIRVLFLVPRLGERVSELIEMPLMLVVITMSARFVTKRFELPATFPVRMTTGLLALGLLIGSELLLALILQERSLAEYVSSRDPVSGSVYLGMLALYAAMPYLISRFGRDPSMS